MIFYRTCRCGAGPEALQIHHIGHGNTGEVLLARCSECWHEVPAIICFGLPGPIADAWNEANMPQGQDAGIEGATCAKVPDLAYFAQDQKKCLT